MKNNIINVAEILSSELLMYAYINEKNIYKHAINDNKKNYEEILNYAKSNMLYAGESVQTSENQYISKNIKSIEVLEQDDSDYDNFAVALKILFSEYPKPICISITRSSFPDFLLSLKGCKECKIPDEEILKLMLVNDMFLDKSKNDGN